MSDSKKLSAAALQAYPNVSYEGWIKSGWTDEQLRAAGWLDAANEASPTVIETSAPSLEEAELAERAAWNKQVRLNQYSPGSAEHIAARSEHKAAAKILFEIKKVTPKDPAMEALDPQVAALIRIANPDVFFLNNDYFSSVPVAAQRIFSYLGNSGELYRRGNAVVELSKDNGVAVITPTAFRSRLNARGHKTAAFKIGRDGTIHAAEKLCSDDNAKLLLSAHEVNLLPEITLVVSSPLLIEVDGRLLLAQPGYNPNCGVLVTGNASVGEVSLDEAVAALLDLVRDFQFATPGDRSRGIAALIAPAIRMGAFLFGDALIDTVEADHSQAGKGTKCKLTYAIYGEAPYPVVQKEGGVGSFDESLSMALLSGKPFITLDNLRGNLRSTTLEGTITPVREDKRVAVRVPYKGEILVDARRTLIQATSNGFSGTIDLANRLLITRLVKQPPSYQYHQWARLGLLRHVEKYSMYFLSCVHAVVRHWHTAGKPLLPTMHTFKEWVGTLDWIVQHVFGAAPLLDGHSAAAARIASPSLSWLRQLAVLVLSEGKAGLELRAGDLREICERHNLLPEGVKPSWEDNAAERAIGKTMASCFVKGDAIELDGVVTTRTERKERYELGRDMRPVKFYTFTKLA